MVPNPHPKHPSSTSATDTKRPGILLNIYESVDVLTLIKSGSYQDLSLSVGEALLRRPDVTIPPPPLYSARIR